MTPFLEKPRTIRQALFPEAATLLVAYRDKSVAFDATPDMAHFATTMAQIVNYFQSQKVQNRSNVAYPSIHSRRA